jgi:hypothetical protein
MDISQSVWNEADASNSTAAPDGAPEGMFPSGVNDTIRADRGAIKRWYNQTIPLVTGGTSTAYTLSYGVAPTALADGMTHLVQFNAVNGAAATLNVNALGAKPLHFYAGSAWGACPANMFAIDQIVRVTYNAAAGTYRCIDTPMVLNQAVSGVTAIDFTGIPTNVNNIEIRGKLEVGTDGTVIAMQVYGTSGSLDTGANYQFWNFGGNTIGGGTFLAQVASGSASILIGNGVNNGSFGCNFIMAANDIQAAAHTLFNGSTNYVQGGGIIGDGLSLSGLHQVAANITGIRILSTGGTMSGKVTVAAK